jgi:vacuolar protein sorting-associated protein 13A/C
MSTSIVLCDVNLDDTRPNREGKISRFMERRESEMTVNLDVPGTSASAIAQEMKEEEKSMIDVTFRMKENEMFADVKVFSFNLILSVDFLMKLSGFLQPPAATTDEDDDELEMIQEDFSFEQQNTRGMEAARKARSVQRQQSQGQEQEATKKAIFAIHIEEYDIILVEKMDDINCLALILNVSYIPRVCGDMMMTLT